MDDQNDNDVFKTMTDQQFADLSKDKSKLFVVMLLIRPNVEKWACYLEYNFYPPNTPENNKFQMYLRKWEEMQWAVIEVPMKDRHIVEQTLSIHGLRLEDGVPTVITNGRMDMFPLNDSNVFSIANVHVKGGSVAIFSKEDKELELKDCEKFIKEHERTNN